MAPKSGTHAGALVERFLDAWERIPPDARRLVARDCRRDIDELLARLEATQRG